MTNHIHIQIRKATVSPIRSNITETYHHPLKRNKRSKNVVHVTILRPSNTRSIYKKSINYHNSSHSIQTDIKNHHQQQNDHRNLSINRIRQHHSSSSKNDIHNNRPRISQMRKGWSDRQGPTIDYHQDSKRSKKKKFTRQCIIKSLLALLILIIIAVVTILLVILLKHKPTKTLNPVLRWNTAGITVAGVTGVPGSTPDRLNAPYSVTLDYLNTLYIADYNNFRVQKYLKDASNGTTVAGNGTLGSSQSQLNFPSSILVDTNSNIFVADTNNNRVQFWANGATSGTTIAGDASGVGGTANNMLSSPYDIALDSNTGTLYITDYNNHRVMSYVSNGSSGVMVAGSNGSGLNNTELNRPVAGYFDSPSNSLIIANIASNNIVRWVLGANHWTLLAGDTSGLAGNTSTLFRNPRHLTLDPMGNLYVLDRDNHRIQFFFADQSSGTTIAGLTEIIGNSSTLLNAPRGMAFDSQLNLYVADRGNHRIQKFHRY